MPVCPVCHQSATNRKFGTCPNCGISLTVIDCHWIALRDDKKPGEVILNHFYRLVSDRESKTYDLAIPLIPVARRAARYKREIRFAYSLLKEADYDLDLVLCAITQLFKNNRFAWKLFSSLLQIGHDFSLALLLEKARQEKEYAQQQQELKLAKDLDNREKIFNGS